MDYYCTISSDYYGWITNDPLTIKQLNNNFKRYALGSELFMIKGFKFLMELSYFTTTTADWYIHLLVLQQI